jgi:uncharacterized protein YqjF (DUF2071 family)
MKPPVLRGRIARRILLNFRVDPEVMARALPAKLTPSLVAGRAIAGVCLIRLEGIRPRGLPSAIGIDSENAAHRVAVRVEGEEGGPARDAVYIFRRDTGSRLNHLAGGRIFPGEHHLARIDARDDGEHVAIDIASDDGTRVSLRARPADDLPAGSCFRSLEEASRFFERGGVGYSVTADPGRLDGMRLATEGWTVRPLAVDEAFSSIFADPGRFPPGSVELDCALVMRDVEHAWHAEPDLLV